MTTPLNAAALLNELDSAGELPTGCRASFLAVRREDFIPDRVWVLDRDTNQHVPSTAPPTPARGVPCLERLMVPEPAPSWVGPARSVGCARYPMQVDHVTAVWSAGQERR